MPLTEIIPAKGKKPMKLSYTRLYFKKTKNRKNEDCFIAKVKEYVTRDGQKCHNGDVVVIGNIRGTNKCPIDREGRWDVVCKQMDAPATGLVVVTATYTVDTATIIADRETFEVSTYYNNREEKLKTEDNKHIPLSFSAKNYYNPETIAENIERKLAYMQLPPDFDKPAFLSEFVKWCREVEEAYTAFMKKPQPVGKLGDPKLETELDRLRKKFNNRG